jgi:hypothetical protein
MDPDADAAPGSEAASDSETGTESDADSVPAAPGSCQEILSQSPGTPSGIYQITLGNGEPYDAYCDMTLDDGGWTAFYVGPLGYRFAEFDGPPNEPALMNNCPSPSSMCLRHIPPTVTAANKFAAKCGDEAVTFEVSPYVIYYFRSGLESQWLLLRNVTAATPHANPMFATMLWTGWTYNPGWILSADDHDPAATPHTFASSYDQPNNGWMYCNGVPYPPPTPLGDAGDAGADGDASDAAPDAPMVWLFYR